jgi:hypothetical protein
MQRLEPPPPHHRPDLTRFREPPDSSRLLRFQSPPAGAPRLPRKAVLAIRRLWLPEQPGSREHEIPVRLAAAMSDYGWQPLRYHLRSFDRQATVTEDYRAIAALCRESDADILILDEFWPTRGGNTAPGEILRALKRERPGLRLVGLYLDPWVPEHWDAIEEGADILDCFWAPLVTALWQRPAFRDKTLFAPVPFGGDAQHAPLRPELAFSGGVQYGNWYRAFWLTAMGDAVLPLRVEVSSHLSEGLNALDGYRAYLQRLGTMGVVLNFSRRSNGSTILTGRTYEVPATGGLLVQERSDDIDLFFVAGRHYLRFETMTDLADIVDLLRTEPERAESIRRAGADFFRENYADDKVIGYLDHFLFHRLARAVA